MAKTNNSTNNTTTVTLGLLGVDKRKIDGIVQAIQARADKRRAGK